MLFRILIATILLSETLLARPTTLRQEEKDEIRYIDKVRSSGFSDRILDRLHYNIAQNLNQIKKFEDGGLIKLAAKYNEKIPDLERMKSEKYFFQDKNGKTFFTVDLGQGLSWEDYPTGRIYRTRAFLYMAEDGKSLTNVIVQFNRVNTDPDIYVKEMRRIVNPTPSSPGPPAIEGEKIKDQPKLQENDITNISFNPDTNDDISLEYYTSNDKDENGDVVWVDTEPVLDQKPGLTQRLNDPTNLLPFPVQKKMLDTYRRVLKNVNIVLERRLHLIELNNRFRVQKMMEIN